MGWPGANLNTVIYTGKELVYVYPNTRKGKILAVDKWAGNIEDTKTSFNFYTPLSVADHKPLPTLKQLETPYYTFTPGGTAKIKNKPCHIVTVHINPDSINTEGLKFSKSDIRFWISDTDSLLLQYDMDYRMLMGNDSLFQYQKLSLDTFSLNTPGIPAAVTMDGIPADILLEEYIIENGPELLKPGTPAPLWKLSSLSDDSLALADLKGNLVLVNFFFKNCYPAMKVMPELQALKDKYASKGLRVIGINPYDLKNEELISLPGKLGLTFPMATYGKKVAADYHVGSYPTLYLIDRNGKVVTSFVGYNNSLKAQLEKAIQDNL
jgi:thiol-disulfide isomerase/thioredoxin